MNMLRLTYLRAAALAALLVGGATPPALGASTINPTVPAQNSQLTSAVVRGNFAAAYNDVSNLLGMYAGTTAPGQPIVGQDWLDTTTTPATWKKRYNSGWATIGTINLSTGAVVMGSAATPVAANLVYSGPTSGGSAVPTFRSLVGADLPLPGASSLGGVFSSAGVSNQFLTGIGTDGAVTRAQPSAANLSNGVSGSGAVVLAASPSIADLTITGSFTAIGLVTNAALANPATTVNGQTCTLGSTCTITAAASAITVGVTTIGSGTNTRVLMVNSGVLGEYSISGSGNVAMTTSPAFTTPNLGTPSALVLTNATGTPSSIGLANGSGLPVASGISGLGTGIATALGVNTGSAGAPVLFDGALGTPASGTLTNALGLPVGGIAAIADNRVIGNVSGGASVPSALTPTQLTTLCNQFTASLSGCVPSPGSPTGQVLSDGGWIPAPGGTGTVTSVDASGGAQTVSGSPITGTGTIRAASLVNAQTGTSYSYQDSDRAKLVTHTNGASIAGTLPQAGGSGNFVSGWFMDVQNRGAGTLTITPTTSTIDGAASLTIATNQGVRIFSDGTNYFTQRGRENNNGTVTSVTCNGGLTGGAITTSGTCAVDIATSSNYYSATASKILDAAVVYTAEVTVTYGTTTTFDFNTFNNAVVTLTGNITTMTFSNARAGKAGTIRFIQDGSGSKTTVWNSALKWASGSAPSLSTAASAVDVLNYFCISASYCVASLMKAVS